MEEYKWVDILLKALKKVNHSFFLILGGKMRKYTKEQIEEWIRPYRESVLFLPGFLSTRKFIESICASDYVIIPYRKSFEATSGPMKEAVRCGVPIIAADHGNIGALTEAYQLGFSFKSEDCDDLSRVIDKALSTNFVKSRKFTEYQHQLSKKSYRESQQQVYHHVLGE